MRSSSSRLRILVAAAFAALAIALTLWLTAPGLMLTADSASYVAAGSSFARAGILLDASGEPYTRWPPLLPLVISVVVATGLPVLETMRVLNGGLFAALVVAVARPLSQTAHMSVAAAAALLVAVHPWFGFVFAHLWSEPLFLVWIALALTSVHSLPRATAFTALACLTRYIGVALVPAMSAALLLDHRWPVRARLRRAAVFTAASVAPLAVWMLRNALLADAAMGERAASAQSFTAALAAAVLATLETIMPEAWTHGIPATIWLALLGALWMLISWRAVRDRSSVAIAASAWVALYVVALCAAAALSPLDDIGPRLLVPVLVAIPLTAAGSVRRLAPAVALLLVAVLSLPQGSALWHSVRVDGPRSLRLLARGSVVVPDGAALVSNRPDAVFLLTGRSAILSPRITPYRSVERVDAADLEQLAEHVRSRPTALVWFHEQRARRLLPLDRLGSEFTLECAWAGANVTVFRLRPRVPGRPVAQRYSC